MLSYCGGVTSDKARLAVLLRRAQWELDDVAHTLPAGRCAPEDRVRLAELLVELAAVLGAHGQPDVSEVTVLEVDGGQVSGTVEWTQD